MGLAMAQANNINNAQYLDRPPTSMNFSPQNQLARRSSLATSVSTASSPESMISDSSRSSRSSSISSASSLVSASAHAKTSVPSRFRPAKLCNERLGSRPTCPSVPEDYDENYDEDGWYYNDETGEWEPPMFNEAKLSGKVQRMQGVRVD